MKSFERALHGRSFLVRKERNNKWWWFKTKNLKHSHTHFLLEPRRLSSWLETAILRKQRVLLQRASRSLADGVRHARWISKSVSELFAVPVSKYLLDDQFDPTKIEPAASNSSTRKLLDPNRPLAGREGLPKLPEIAPKPNILKRAFNSENHDESSTEIDLRPLKRMRAQLVPSPQPVIQSSRPQSPAPALFPTPAARTDIFYPSPANSSPLRTPNHSEPAPRGAEPLRRIDFTALKPTPSMPMHSFSRSRLLPRRLTAPNPRTNTTNNENNPHPPSLPSNPTRPSIAAILRAPRCVVHRFVVSETYKDKVFVFLS
ncbi:hypothetical protein K438DRAFT_1760333 [Mycena galopus ATCC 62051]|nr:hypothetical protein K438DRAFT_1760333 [Mycena galopus ATCC 62051]